VLYSRNSILQTQKHIEDLVGEPAKEWLEREYPSRTMKSICQELGIGHTQRLSRLMEYLDIHIRSDQEQGELLWKQHPEFYELHKEVSIKTNREMSFKRPTSIEKIMMKGLDDARIDYEFQGVVEGKFTCDFVLRNHLLIIECDGTYWHSKPDAIIRDARKDAYLQTIGWTILRFSDTAINKDVSSCVQAIRKIINHH
jgi:Uncharacterized protein conserved in bacteria